MGETVIVWGGCGKRGGSDEGGDGEGCMVEKRWRIGEG